MMLEFCQRDKEKHQRLPVLSIHFYMIHFTIDAGWPQGVFMVSLQCVVEVSFECLPN